MIIFDEQLHLDAKQCFVSQLPADRLSSLDILTVIEASFCTVGCKRSSVLVISNADISCPIHPTVLKFGEHARVIILFVPTKFHAAWITRSRSSKGVVSPRPCVFSLQCPATSTLDNSASLRPIGLRFGEDVQVSVL